MNKRYYGIDLLRSVSMLMIVVLHVLGVGGVLSAELAGSSGYFAAWLLETMCMCSVNCFGLISGYVVSKGRHRYSRLFSLWVRVALEGLFVTAAFAIFTPGTVSGSDWLLAATPVFHNVYWYFTAYFALFLFVPFINRMLAALRKREMLVLAGTIIVLFCVLNNLTKTEIFALGSGYSFLWLCSLYVLGGILRALEVKDSFGWGWLAAAFIVLSAAALAIMLLTGRQGAIGYTSPFILAASVALLLLFRRLRLDSPRSVKLISLLTRTSFGVYITHTQPLIWARVLYTRFTGYGSAPMPLMLLEVLSSALVIYLLCTLADWLVEKLLKLVRIEKLEVKIDVLCDKLTGTRQKAQNTSGN